MMKGSIVVFGGSAEGRRNSIENLLVGHLGFKPQKLDVGPKVEDNIVKTPDLLFVALESGKNVIGIGQARDLIKFISQKPFSNSHRGAVVWSAHLLNATAQNSLLKTLEEPPEYAFIILESKTLGALLPTVVSRCQRVDASRDIKSLSTKDKVVKANTQNKENEKFSLNYVLSQNKGRRLEIADELSKLEKAELIEILEGWVEEGRELAIESSSEIHKVLTSILEVKKDLEETNVNTKLALEFLVLLIDF